MENTEEIIEEEQIKIIPDTTRFARVVQDLIDHARYLFDKCLHESSKFYSFNVTNNTDDWMLIKRSTSNLKHDFGLADIESIQKNKNKFK